MTSNYTNQQIHNKIAQIRNFQSLGGAVNLFVEKFAPLKYATQVVSDQV